MTKREFLKLTKKAAQADHIDQAEAEPLLGIGLHKDRVMVSELGAISFIVWQCRKLFGGWDYEELQETQRVFRRVDLIDQGVTR